MCLSKVLEKDVKFELAKPADPCHQHQSADLTTKSALRTHQTRSIKATRTVAKPMHNSSPPVYNFAGQLLPGSTHGTFDPSRYNKTTKRQYDCGKYAAQHLSSRSSQM
jgi:hypothetical protein